MWKVGSNNDLSSLHLLSNGTFVYSHRGCFCQSSITYDVLFKDKKEDEFEGYAMISSSNGNYITVNNWNDGISIFKVDYI